MRPGGLMAESLLTSRERVLALVTSQPGLHLRELPRRLGLSLRSVRYHLEGLEESDRVTPHRSGRFARWFAAGAVSAENPRRIAVLQIAGLWADVSRLLRECRTRFSSLAQWSCPRPATPVRPSTS